MPLSTILGLNEHPALLDGYGAIPAVMAREVATTGTWRCAVTDDRPSHVHGTLLATGRGTYTPAYTPSDRAWQFIVDRDRHCTFPGCRRDAARADLDHRTPWPAADTCDCNLAALCPAHHTLKHQTRFRVHRDTTGGWTWTTPSGHHFDRPPTTHPHAPIPDTPIPGPMPGAPGADGVHESSPPDQAPPPF
jgi:hypothetical protein